MQLYNVKSVCGFSSVQFAIHSLRNVMFGLFALLCNLYSYGKDSLIVFVSRYTLLYEIPQILTDRLL